LRFTTDEVCAWLKTENLGDLEEVITQQEIDGATLSNLDKDDLKEARIGSLLTRAKLLGKWNLLALDYEEC
jgi:hypothetical protein